MNQIKGKQSIEFENPPHIISGASVVGKKEGEGPLGHLFDLVNEDAMFGMDSWEEAESEMQKEASKIAVKKAKLEEWQIRYAFSGDLLGQLIATSFGLKEMQLPLFGLYGACSTMGEALQLGAMTVNAGYGDYVLCMASSHFASAEKQFRYPLEYANQRPLSASWTVTGCGAFVLGRGSGDAYGCEQQKQAGQKKSPGYVKITGITTGKIIDYGVKDSMNMGACMAPSAADTIYQNFLDFDREPKDYDRIITGDLGSIGKEILIKLLKDKGYDIGKQHTDCGLEIYDGSVQDTHAGGSGCGCSAVTLAAYILDQLAEGNWNRVLFVPTGALLSTVSFNEGQSIPGIAHAVVLEKV